MIERRAYKDKYRARCLEIFDLNCPTAFAPEERVDYERYLSRCGSDYTAYFAGGRIVGACGLHPADAAGESSLNWILTDPTARGTGLGRTMMLDIIDRAHARGSFRIYIAASHVSEPFFAHFGARRIAQAPNGWGPGMHRIDMILVRRADPGGH